MPVTNPTCFCPTPQTTSLFKSCAVTIHRNLSNGVGLNQPVDGALATLIVDTDAGFDDLLAISTIKSNRAAKVPFISTVGGMQDNPDRAARYLKKIFPGTLHVVPGDNTHLKNSPVQNWLRESRISLDSLMHSDGVAEFPPEEVKKDANYTSVKVTKFLAGHPGNVDIMCLGPLTNIASWLDHEHSRKLIEDKVDNIWIMGGNIPSEETADPEYNFNLDSESMSKVFLNERLRDKIFLVPMQTCSRQIVSKGKWDEIVEHGKKGKGIISKILSKNSDWHLLKYDAICAFAYANNNIYDGEQAVINHEMLSVTINSNTGLLQQPSREHMNDAIKIKFVTNISMNEEFGFLAWLCKAIENEQSAYF